MNNVETLENYHVIFHRVAGEFPKSVPDFIRNDGTVLEYFRHGHFRIMESMGDYVVIYGQAVRNKHSNESKIFVATVPLGWAKETKPGQSFPVESKITLGTSQSEVEEMARKSFSKLQELVIEFHNI